jgi:hypothetical protein
MVAGVGNVDASLDASLDAVAHTGSPTSWREWPLTLVRPHHGGTPSGQTWLF